MTATTKVYPEWVQAQRKRGTTVKKKGDTYYLYKRTSKRIPGKKYPQPVDTYIGIITPEGVIPSNKRKVSLAEIEVWEYGFSKAIWDLCPEDWKKPLGGDWEDVLKIIILKWSPNSHLGRANDLKAERDFHYQFPSQASSLGRRFHRAHGMDIGELECLKTIYLVSLEGKTVVSKINPEQRVLIDRLGLEMEAR